MFWKGKPTSHKDEQVEGNSPAVLSKQMVSGRQTSRSQEEKDWLKSSVGEVLLDLSAVQCFMVVELL